MTATGSDVLLTQEDCSARTQGRVKPATFEKWRVAGKGPRFVKFGRRVFYRERDFDAWLTERTVSHTRAMLPRQRRKTSTG